jgi:hypothetical protein
MTVLSSTRKAGPYSCNGATVAFPFSFKVFKTADVRVVLTNTNAGESDLALSTNYTVALNADQDANPGGTVTTTVAYATGYKITLTSQVQNLQPVTLTNQGGFYPKIINDALDRLTILAQQLAEQIERAVKTGISSSSTPDQLLSDIGTAVTNASNSATAAAGSATTAANSAAQAANSATSVGFTITDLQNQGKTAVASAGTAPNFTVTTSPAYGALASGQRIRVKFHTVGVTGNNTLNRDGLGAKNLMQYDATGTKVPAAVVAEMLTDVEYDGTDMVVLDPLPSAGGVVQGVFKNLRVSATGTNANVSITADEIAVEDGNNAVLTARNVNLTVNTAANGANGLDTGSLAASTWYSVWVVRKQDGTTAGLISTATTSPTMPIGYTLKARVGWIRTDGTGNKYPLGFKQSGRKVQYLVAANSNVTSLPLMASGVAGALTFGGATTWASVSTSTFVPPTASHIKLFPTWTSGAAQIDVAPNNSYGGNNVSNNPAPVWFWSSSSSNQIVSPSELMLESSNIYWASNQAGNYLWCFGWEDNI